MLITGVSTFYSTHHELDELFDAQLAQYARLVRHLFWKSHPVSREQNTIIEVPRIMEDDAQTTTARNARSKATSTKVKLQFKYGVKMANFFFVRRMQVPFLCNLMEAGYHVIKYDDQMDRVSVDSLPISMSGYSLLNVKIFAMN